MECFRVVLRPQRCCVGGVPSLFPANDKRMKNPARRVPDGVEEQMTLVPEGDQATFSL
jgi:hypothetical protein